MGHSERALSQSRDLDRRQTVVRRSSARLVAAHARLSRARADSTRALRLVRRGGIRFRASRWNRAKTETMTDVTVRGMKGMKSVMDLPVMQVRTVTRHRIPPPRRGARETSPRASGAFSDPLLAPK